ncbi:uncharacterized protein [Nerophis lumbriciformis]|uniref:uncharacterized protein isoform X1 n=2 Tax=Nerophis lumbriciformis TaxID=546530 RepID=UPI003BACD01A
MNVLDGLEIYIPEEAQIKNIAIWSLPPSVVRGLGLTAMDPNCVKVLADSPRGIWICPAVLRSTATHDARSLLTAEFQLSQSPLKIYSTSSSVEAYNVLRNNMPGTCRPRTALLSHVEKVPHISEDAIIIYKQHIYLMMRVPTPGRQGTCEAREPLPHSASPDEDQKKLDEQHAAAQDQVEHFSDNQNHLEQAHSVITYEPPDSYKWLTSESPHSDFCSTPKEDFDYKELEQQEKIARMKAILKEKLSSLCATK